MDLPIINKTYEVYKAIIEMNEKIPKRQKFGIGLSLENSILECFDYLIMAKNAPKTLKVPYLIKASSQLEIATFKLRLLLELYLVNETKVFQIQAKLAEIGRMLGGWMKSVQNS